MSKEVVEIKVGEKDIEDEKIKKILFVLSNMLSYELSKDESAKMYNIKIKIDAVSKFLLNGALSLKDIKIVSSNLEESKREELVKKINNFLKKHQNILLKTIKDYIHKEEEKKALEESYQTALSSSLEKKKDLLQTYEKVKLEKEKEKIVSRISNLINIVKSIKTKIENRVKKVYNKIKSFFRRL